GRLPKCREMSPFHLRLIDTAGPRNRITDISWKLLCICAGSNSQVVGDRHVDSTVEVVPRLRTAMHGACAGGNGPSEAGGRRINSDELDEAAQAVRAIQRSLRSAQHFNACQIARIDIGRRTSAIYRN